MIKKSLILAFVVAFIAGCGGYGRGASGVVPTSLAVSPLESSQPIGADRQFFAILTFSDNSTRDVTAQATWSSSANSIATMVLPGLATPIAPGDTTISASYSAAGPTLSAAATLHVTTPDVQSITISPAINQLELGANQQLAAIGKFTDGRNVDLTQAVSWTSSDPSVFRVSTSSGRIGLLNTRGPGTATVSASLNGVSGIARGTVTRRVPKFLFAGGDTGIVGYTINATTGTLVPLPGGSFGGSGFINGLAVTRDRKFLYAADPDTGVIWAFKIESSGALIQIPGSPFTTGSAGPFQFPFSVLTSPVADLLFMTDFGTGILTTFTIGVDGSLTPQGSSIAVGANPASPFRAAITPDGRFTYQTPSTPGQIAGFSIATNGALATITGGRVLTVTRPSDVTIEPSGQFLYAAIVDGTPENVPPAVLGFAINPVTGVLTSLPSSPLTLAGSPFSLAADASGRFLYVGNAGPDSTGVSGFSIDSNTGAATTIPGASIPTGSLSISMAVDPSAQFLYVGLNGSQGIQAFRIDQQTGALTEINGSPFPALNTVFAFATIY